MGNFFPTSEGIISDEIFLRSHKWNKNSSWCGYPLVSNVSNFLKLLKPLYSIFTNFCHWDSVVLSDAPLHASVLGKSSCSGLPSAFLSIKESKDQ